MVKNLLNLSNTIPHVLLIHRYNYQNITNSFTSNLLLILNKILDNTIKEREREREREREKSCIAQQEVSVSNNK